MNNFKSKYNYFWKFLFFLIITSSIFNFKDIISFNTLFMIIIPNWIFTLILFKIETSNIKKELFMIFNDTDINNLFSNDSLKNRKEVIFFKDKYNKISSLFVYVSAISIMIFLLSSVFIMMKYIKQLS